MNNKYFYCYSENLMLKLKEKGLRYITDYNDDITETCVCCKKKITPKAMNTEEWIADLVFKIKGH